MSTQRRGRPLFQPFRAARSDAERLRALLAAQQAVAGEREVEDVLRVALEHALAFTGLAVGIGLVQTPAGDRVLVRSVVGSPPAGGLDRPTVGTVLRAPLLPLYEQAAADRRPLQHPVPRGEGMIATAARAGHPTSYLVLPLISARDRVLGALLLASGEYQQPLAPEDVEVLHALSGAITPAVEGAQLHEQLERSLDELITLYGAGQAISSSLEIRDVLDGILEMSRRLTRADYCLITGTDASGEPVALAESGGGGDWLGYRTTPSVRLTINAVLRDGALRPVGIPPVTGWCIGLKVRQKVIGTLEVYARGGAPRYDESHLLNGLATQAAIAIENAKLYQEVRRKERHLQNLVERMIQAQEEEQRRVAYDIHDGLAQMMVSAHQRLQTFGILHARQDARADEELAKGLFMLQKSIEEVRKVIAGLRPAELDDLGLIPALQLHLQSLRDDQGWQIELREEIGPERLPATVEVTAYRIVQEALNNARRHGEAKRARVELLRDGAVVNVLVQDWGRGFDVTELDGRSSQNGELGHHVTGRHVGVHGMRERANLLNGTFSIESSPGEGTVVRVMLPIPEDADLATPFPFDFVEIASGISDEAGLADGMASSGGAVGHWPSER
ncbi:MAG TPA: GAF domain-containing sensor histidine kinase [Chloroflexota bacterium]|nr:GAF domain-containing sensor histidine kinase [Chloroflexota bacterium]